jgi:hypothetical protein
MIREFTYSFVQLDVKPSEIAVLLGYPDGNLPEPFAGYLSEAISKAATFGDIRGAVFMADQISFSDNKDRLITDGIEFLMGKTVAKELRNSEAVALFICTAGQEISELSRTLMYGDDPVLGYVYDVLGSVTVEAAMDKIHQEIKEMAALKGQLATNRYSPGYCNWSVADQHKLFSFFPENCCGVSLTESALMHPIKSVSGIIGLGKEVRYREYTCNLCGLAECFYRNRNMEKTAKFE